MANFLETARLILRPFTVAGTDDFSRRTTTRRSCASSMEASREAIQAETLPRLMRDHPHRGYWAAEEKTTGIFLGAGSSTCRCATTPPWSNSATGSPGARGVTATPPKDPRFGPQRIRRTRRRAVDREQDGRQCPLAACHGEVGPAFRPELHRKLAGADRGPRAGRSRIRTHPRPAAGTNLSGSPTRAERKRLR